MRPVVIGTPWLVILMALLGLLIADSSASAEQSADVVSSDASTLANIIINRRNIFDEQDRLGYRLINRLHRVTRETVIEREIWLQPGEQISDADADELERNLRKLDLFAHVRVSLKKNRSQPGSVDLVIETADRLSIVASAGGSFLGGIGEVKFSIGENNLLGLGHQLQFGYSENTEGELLGSVAYENVLIGANDIYAGVRTGQTEEGEFTVLSVTNRFLNFDDNRFWKIEFERESKRDDFFESGESIAEVPRTDEQLKLQWQQRVGVPARLIRFGPVIDLKQTWYESPIGPQADSVERPEDVTSVFAGAFVAIDSNRSFERLTGLDTLRFEQDVTLGFSAQLLVGLENRAMQSDTVTDPTFFIKGWSTNAISAHSYLNMAIDSFASVDNDSLSRWSVSTASTLFNTRFARQTLAARIKYKSAFDSGGLPPQQTLGEVKGLRGYPAREFNGEQSLLLNLEHRWRSPLTLASVELGTVAFFDAGWVGSRGSSDWLDRAQTATGVGLRIGSPQLLGSAVIRIDIAYPLDTTNYDPSFSLALGQVFGFRP
jgi:outer membrane protein assembly factor BamA